MGRPAKRSYLKSWPLIKRCLGYFSIYKMRIALAILSMGVVAACTAAVAFLVQPALDDIFIRKDKSALLLLPAVFIVLIILKGLFRFLQNYEMRVCGLKVLERLRNELNSKIIRLPVNFFEDHQVGMLMSRIVNDVTMIRTSLPAIVMLVREVLTMTGLIAIVFYRDAYLAFWAVLALPLAVYPFVYFGRKLRKIGRKTQSKIADISTFLQEIFSGIRVVKAFANEHRENENFMEENARLVRIAEKEVIFSELSSPVMELVGAVGIGLVIWYGGSQVIAGQSTPGTFFSFLAALIMLYDPVKKLNSANMDIQRALAGAERVFEILDSPEIRVEQGGDAAFAPPFESLVLEDLEFTYPGCPAPALDKVSLTVAAGQRVALVGPSGAGKTTLVNMIPRFYKPQGGKIILNGRSLEEYGLESLRKNIGMVSQDAFLFNASVRDNIAYAQDGVDPEAVRTCAEAAFAHEFIQELPQGYETVLGERGVKISGGQKQRLTIARALLKNPPLLILDEATSALDTESERKVQLALENLMRGRTSIVIAHRISTVLSADNIVVMERGRVMAQGKHAELLETSPLYAKLYQMQFQDETQASG